MQSFDSSREKMECVSQLKSLMGDIKSAGAEGAWDVLLEKDQACRETLNKLFSYHMSPDQQRALQAPLSELLANYKNIMDLCQRAQDSLRNEQAELSRGGKAVMAYLNH